MRSQRSRGRDYARDIIAVFGPASAESGRTHARVVLTRELSAWSRMTTLERVLVADREDPSFDYAAN